MNGFCRGKFCAAREFFPGDLGSPARRDYNPVSAVGGGNGGGEDAMKAVHHGAVSLASGGLLWLTMGNLGAAVACFFTGLLLDLDHLVDYLCHRPRANTLADLVDVCENCRLDRVVLPLHSWELLALAALAAALLPAQRALLAGAAVGLGTHLLADQLSNPVTGRAYLLLHRWRHGFRRGAFFDEAAVERLRDGAV